MWRLVEKRILSWVAKLYTTIHNTVQENPAMGGQMQTALSSEPRRNENKGEPQRVRSSLKHGNAISMVNGQAQ